jgi:hypothetical protein
MEILDLTSDCFKDEGNEEPRMMFGGMIFTDGVGISILKMNQDTNAEGPGG